MKVGNLVRYKAGGEKYGLLAIVTYVNVGGETVRAVDTSGELQWLTTSYCEVVNESR